LPELRGRTLEEAQQLVQPLGVTLAEVNKPGIFTDRVPAGRIAEQSPEPNAPVPPDGTIRVTLSRGPAVVVPDLRNQEVALATRLLTEKGLRVERSEEPSREIREGWVVRSDPVAGASVEQGGTVTLVVSAGDKVPVPDIFGVPVLDALRIIEEAGLKRGTIAEQTRDQVPPDQQPAFDKVPPGGVLSATPTYGTWVPRGSMVDIAIRKP
jgi:serine/threonine-protein kinase